MEEVTDSFDGNEWELSKENVQPLKKGRKMANLTAALAPSSVDQTRIYREKQEFEAQIRTYEGQDPLEIWYRYIVWTSENFPKGGKDLGNLLERCMTTFKDQERYRDDERYAKVWLHYTDICTDPMEIFQYMHSQQLCSGLALFYESWAQLLEGFGDHKKADEVYNLGILRNAQPLDRLKEQHRGFELRLAERVSNGLQQVSLRDENEPERITLGGLKRQGKKGTVGTKRTGNATLSQTGGISGFNLQTSQTKNSGIKIFCDDDPGASSSLPPSTGEWKMPPTQHVSKKENTRKPGKWTDAKISQRNQFASVPLSGTTSRPDFSVHVDEDVGNHPPPTPQQHLHFDKVLSARKPDKPFVTEALRNKTENTEGQATRVMYCKEKIYAGTEEFSFEELRAARIFQKIREGTYNAPDKLNLPQNNLRYMYPKKEVYSFDGEFQYEEILARRYYARLKKQDVSVGHASQENSVPSAIGGYAGNEEMYPVESGSWQKNVDFEVRSTSLVNEQAHSSLAFTARRGLSFADQPVSFLPSEEHANAAPSCSTYPKPDLTFPTNTLQSSCTKSAFQPVRSGLGFRQHQGDMMSTQQNAINSLPGNNLFDMSSCNDTENLLIKQVRQAEIPGALTGQKTKPCDDNVSSSESGTGNKVVFFRTPDANRSGELNSSNLTGPSPTVCTKQALLEVGNMFRLPLESDRHADELNQTEKDFEAAFSGDCATSTFSAGLGAADFVIYTDENASSQDTKDVENREDEDEDKENTPPSGRREEPVNRPFAGVLQPSVGIPTCPLENEEYEDDEDKEDPNTQHKYQEACQHTKISELSLAEFSHDQTTLTSSNFAAAARMASTPFSRTIGPSSLPSIPFSTIRPTDGNPAFASDDDVFASAQVGVGQANGSFASPPSNVLSPILEGSHEDTKSTNSSQSSNGSSRRGSCSVIVSQQNGLELSKIQEETSMCETADLENIATNVGGTVINPFSGEVVDAFLRKISPPLSCYFGFFESSEEMPRIAVKTSVCFGKDRSYYVQQQLGSGAFAKVYLARTRAPDVDVDPEDVETDETCIVLKVQKISIEWEFYISRQLHGRMQDLGCSKELHDMVMNPLAAYVYSNSSVLMDTYQPVGTILDMVNKYKVNKKNMEEGVMFFYTIALLRILETLHSCDIIHGDVKPDNFLVLDCDVDARYGQPLRVIDFGRSIDMKLFPAGTKFTTNCYTDDFQCVEMKEGRPWTTEIDTYGILGTIHCFLFLDYMKVHKDAKGRWKINKSFKRHWKPIWSELFDTLLNTRSCEEQPSLRDFREEFERLFQFDEENYLRQKKVHERFLF